MSIAARRMQRSGVADAVTLYKFGFEAGTNGSTVTTSVTAAGDRPWDAIGIGSGASLVYGTTHAMSGSFAARLDPGSSVSTVTRWSTSGSLSGAYRYYVWWDTNPTVDTTIAWFGSTTSAKVASIVISSAGNIRVYGTPVASAYSTSAGALPLGVWVRVELAYQVDPTTSTNGKVRLGTYLGDSTTAIADSGWVTTDLGTAGTTYVRVGKYDSGANTTAHWLDAITFANGATSLLGPEGVASNQVPVANAGTNQTVATSTTVTLDGSGSADVDGTIASYAWTQTSGASVTLSSASAESPTFTAPSTADTLIFSLIVTDNDGALSSADTVTITVSDGASSYDWSDTNLPWAYSSTSEFTTDWPSSVTIVDIQTGSSDFYTNLVNTVNAASGRVVIRLGAGVYHLNSFRLYGSSGSPTYSFGFYNSRLQGFLGQGPDKTFVQMDANSMTQDQLDALAVMTTASYAPNQMGFCRFDGSDPASPVLLAGLTFRAADQQNLTAVASDVPAVVPQPAPHNGVILYQNAYAQVSYVRFQAAGRAVTSSPPFEHANIGSQYGTISFKKCEFDGRRSPDLDAAQPRRCGPIMANNETSHTMTDCWVHHSNISRYAANDQNRDTGGPYMLIRCKLEQISNTQNVDPALNGGVSLNGYSNPCCLGWETVNSPITLTDCIISQDDPYTDKYSVAQHLGFTTVGSTRGTNGPQGGRLTVTGGIFYNTAWPQLNGFLCIRALGNTYWVIDGYATTMMIYDSSGTRKSPYVYSGTWPPTAAQLTAVGVTPETHYLIRNTTS